MENINLVRHSYKGDCIFLLKDLTDKIKEITIEEKEEFVQTVEKPLSLSKNGVWGVAPSGVRAAAPHSAPHSARHGCRAYTAFHTGEWVFGKDAEIRTHQALHEAKPSECPKGDRD